MHNSKPAVISRHRLVRKRRKINDSQPAMRKRSGFTFAEVNSGIIGSTVGRAISRLDDLCRIELLSFKINYTEYTAQKNL
jgi:hypothetical protein